MGIGHLCTEFPKLQETCIKPSQWTSWSPIPWTCDEVLILPLFPHGTHNPPKTMSRNPLFSSARLAILSPWLQRGRVTKLVSFLLPAFSPLCTWSGTLLKRRFLLSSGLSRTSWLISCYMFTLRKKMNKVTGLLYYSKSNNMLKASYSQSFQTWVKWPEQDFLGPTGTVQIEERRNVAKLPPGPWNHLSAEITKLFLILWRRI